MSGRELPRAARSIPPSTAEVRHPGRTCHWIKGNETERIPHRWIVADTETRAVKRGKVETQTLRCWDAVRWRDDLKTGERREEASGESAGAFWSWVLEWCYRHGRTVLWFHNAGFDVSILDMFTHLAAMGCELVWCNLDRDVSVAKWSTPGGTLVIADTYTWTNVALEQLAGMVDIPKPRLPAQSADLAKWHARCRADVLITEAVARQLLTFIKLEHLGNWQPSGAGMGHTAWRHRFMTHKVLVHDDAEALEAERAAMHAGRAEAWWHGRAEGGPFTEWDMRMSYTQIAADSLLPAKLWDTDSRPTRRVHEWALEHWRVLAQVEVQTEVPCVPARVGERVCWPVGRFHTVLWDAELALLRENGGRYRVIRQWRYTRKPVLAEWARWSIERCQLEVPAIGLVAKTWVKHQARATIGRMGLRTASWELYADNWLDGYTGLSLITEEGSQARRAMHVGSQVWAETGRDETQQSVPQIPSWIMAEARCRLWRAGVAAGLENTVHVDTDSAITNAAGTARLELAVAAGLPGNWRPKATWRSLEIVGPRHYFAPGKRQVPGVPTSARAIGDGKYAGEVWERMATALVTGRTGEVRVTEREWQPKHVDYRRPYQGESDGPALPMRVGEPKEDTDARSREADRGNDRGQASRPGDLAAPGGAGRDDHDPQDARGGDRGAGHGHPARRRAARPDRRGAATGGAAR